MHCTLLKFWMAAVAMVTLGSWSTLNASNYYSGMRQVAQPNNVTFQACRWGDEFSWEHETDTGYTIIRNPSDGYYYYAILDSLGDYTPSDYRVAIDNPVSIPQHLRRTDPILSHIQDEVEEADLLRHYQQEWYEEHHLSHYNELLVGVILVEFENFNGEPLLCRRMEGNPDEPFYSFADFELALTSTDEYLSAEPYNNHSPDGGEVFGSLRDYWREVSRWVDHEWGVDVEVVILNDSFPENPLKLDWLRFPDALPGAVPDQDDNVTVWYWAINQIATLPAGITSIAVVGASDEEFWGPVGGYGVMGYEYPEGSTNPLFMGGFTVFERWSHENPPYWFTNIGMWCHEAGHGIFGWYDWCRSFDSHNPPEGWPYIGEYPASWYFQDWCLMQHGSTPGPQDHPSIGSCPPHPAASVLLSVYNDHPEYNWIQPIEITTNQPVELGYNENLHFPVPKIYFVTGNQANPTIDYWLLENRRYVGFNRYNAGNAEQWNPANPPVLPACGAIRIYPIRSGIQFPTRRGLRPFFFRGRYAAVSLQPGLSVRSGRVL